MIKELGTTIIKTKINEKIISLFVLLQHFILSYQVSWSEIQLFSKNFWWWWGSAKQFKPKIRSNILESIVINSNKGQVKSEWWCDVFMNLKRSSRILSSFNNYKIITNLYPLILDRAIPIIPFEVQTQTSTSSDRQPPSRPYWLLLHPHIQTVSDLFFKIEAWFRKFAIF